MNSEIEVVISPRSFIVTLCAAAFLAGFGWNLGKKSAGYVADYAETRIKNRLKKEKD